MESATHTHIHNAQLLAEQLRQLPVTSLRPYSNQIDQLSATINQLRHAVSSGMGSISRVNPAAGPAVSRSRQVSARAALEAAQSTALFLQTTLREEHFSAANQYDFFFFLHTPSDPRVSHLQGIFSFQKSTAPIRTDVRDRFLLACSCYSLATDFDTYEQSQGWQSKHQILLSRLLGGKDPAIQQHKRHQSNFLASLAGVNVHREKYDAALRLGTKMKLIQSASEFAGIGSAVGLLMAFECQKLSRLPYREFAQLFALLQDHTEDAVPFLTAFCCEFDAWWNDVAARYHHAHRQTSRPPIGCSPVAVADQQLSIATRTSVDTASLSPDFRMVSDHPVWFPLRPQDERPQGEDEAGTGLLNQPSDSSWPAMEEYQGLLSSFADSQLLDQMAPTGSYFTAEQLASCTPSVDQIAIAHAQGMSY